MVIDSHRGPDDDALAEERRTRNRDIRKRRIRRAARAMASVYRDPIWNNGRRDPYLDGWNAAVETALPLGLDIGLDFTIDTGRYAQPVHDLTRRYFFRYRRYLMLAGIPV